MEGTNQKAAFSKEELEMKRSNQKAEFSEEEELQMERTNQKAAFSKELEMKITYQKELSPPLCCSNC